MPIRSHTMNLLSGKSRAFAIASNTWPRTGDAAPVGCIILTTIIGTFDEGNLCGCIHGRNRHSGTRSNLAPKLKA